MAITNYSAGLNIPGFTVNPLSHPTLYTYGHTPSVWDPAEGDNVLPRINVTSANETANATEPYFPEIIERPVMGIELILVPVFFSIIVLVGVTGNCIVLYIIFKHKEMQTVTNYYIANLALTDVAFLLICTTSTAALYGVPIWILGDFMCRFVGYMQYVSVQATCATLTAMTVDRHFLIVHAVRSRNATIRKPVMAMMISVFIWIGAFLLHVPVAIYTMQVVDGGKTFCRKIFPNTVAHRIYEFYAFFVMYLLPLGIVTICYGMILEQVWRRTSSGTESAQAIERSIRRKRKITRMVLIVVILFAICWGPLQVMNQWMILDKAYPYDSVPVYHFRIFCLCLAYTNSCVNPFVYAFATNSFRKYFKKLFNACCPYGYSRAPSSSTFRSRPTQNSIHSADE
ncbi:G-protein coupled receptor 54-like isoform X2 [Ptychodera flava]|uniref:G-protein coupled receptor 54-like isoform X2 n=1 Tax=Ptychodera flava TaxID=63121 RepID=UPI00396A3653